MTKTTLWAVYRKGYMLNYLMRGLRSTCEQLLCIMGKKSYTLELYEPGVTRHLRRVIDAERMLRVIGYVNHDSRHKLAKKTIKFLYAPPLLIRQNARYILPDTNPAANPVADTPAVDDSDSASDISE